VLISEAGARTLWPNEDAVGKRVKIGQGGFDKGDGAEIVGVVGDVRQWADSAGRTEVYLPFAQSPRTGAIVFVRSSRDAASLGPEIRRAIHEIAPSFPIYDMQTMENRAVGATAQARFSAELLGLFAFSALSLAVIGLYGVMSLAVTARTREIGIRIALGADHGRVQRLVVREAVLDPVGGQESLEGLEPDALGIGQHPVQVEDDRRVRHRRQRTAVGSDFDFLTSRWTGATRRTDPPRC